MRAIVFVLFATTVVLIVVMWVRMKSHSKRIFEYFCNAIKVHAFTGEQDAKIAAVMAAKTATGAQRNLMIAHLRIMASDLKQMNKSDSRLNPFADNFVKSVAELKKEISIKDWTSNDIKVQKEKLRNTNHEYLEALNRYDPVVFVRKYPDLFK